MVHDLLRLQRVCAHDTGHACSTSESSVGLHVEFKDSSYEHK